MRVEHISGIVFSPPRRRDITFTLVSCEIVFSEEPKWIDGMYVHPCIYTFRVSNRGNRLCNFYFAPGGDLEKVKFNDQDRWFLTLDLAEKNENLKL
jgi:hypothetical protein